MFRKLIYGTAGVATTGIAALSIGEYNGSDSGAVRSYRFWKGAVPIYTHYKYTEWKMKGETDPGVVSAAYRPLHEKYSPIVKDLTLDLRGFYYKLAQTLSTRDDFLADEYITWTKQLQDQSPVTMDLDSVKEIVEDGLQVDFDAYFDEFDPQPIGSASIGQVHRAVLAEDGREVAVKVQFPGIETKFRNDIDTVELFCKYLMPQNASYFSEIKKQFVTEFDMTGEAANLREAYDNVMDSDWKKFVSIPSPINASRQVLVMEYLDGSKLIDGIRDEFRYIAEKDGMTMEEYEQEQKKKLEMGLIERKEVSEVSSTTRRLGSVLRLTDALVNSIILVWNYSLPLITGYGALNYLDSSPRINLGEIVELLLRVHGHQIFFNGAFNGDPHPGNILLMKQNRLGLIDYGQVKRMSLEDRIMYAKLIIALSRDDKPEVVRIMIDEVGIKTKRMDHDIIYKIAAFYNCRDSEDILGSMNVSEFMEWTEKVDPLKQINDELVMVGRVSLLLRGLANAFAMKVRVSDYWKIEAMEFLKQQGIEY